MYKYFKSLTLLLLIVVTFSTIVPKECKAAIDTNIEQVKIIYDDQGGYIVETIENNTYNLSSSNYIATYATAQTTTTTKTKTIKYYNSNNILCWKYSLTATFIVKQGKSVSYKSSKATLNHNNAWKFVSEKHSGSGGKATGTIKMQKKGTTISKTVTIKCDKYGKFS